MPPRKPEFGSDTFGQQKLFDANRSYQHFKEHNEARFFSKNNYSPALPSQTSQTMFGARKEISLPLKVITSGAKHGAIDLGIHAIDKRIPGLGKFYVGPKIHAISGILDASERIRNPLVSTTSKLEKTLCGGLGAGAKTTVSVVGTGAVLSSAGALVASTEGLGTFLAIPYAISGLSVVEQMSKSTGDLTELACHKGFQGARKLETMLKR